MPSCRGATSIVESESEHFTRPADRHPCTQPCSNLYCMYEVYVVCPAACAAVAAAGCPLFIPIPCLHTATRVKDKNHCAPRPVDGTSMKKRNTSRGLRRSSPGPGVGPLADMYPSHHGSPLAAPGLTGPDQTPECAACRMILASEPSALVPSTS